MAAARALPPSDAKALAASPRNVFFSVSFPYCMHASVLVRM
jgi:hypothetical protein